MSSLTIVGLPLALGLLWAQASQAKMSSDQCHALRRHKDPSAADHDSGASVTYHVWLGMKGRRFKITMGDVQDGHNAILQVSTTVALSPLLHVTAPLTIQGRMNDTDPKNLIRIAHENGEGSVAQPLDLGARVRELRKAHDWTLEQAAQRAGLARSTLSKIENGQMSPTYDALKKLAEGLQISVPQLFTPPSKGQVNGRMAVTKGGEETPKVTTTYEHALLAETLTTKKMLPYRARIRARDIADFEGWVRHDGEEFLYVLTGQVRLYTEFYEPVDLKRGDSAYYDASMGHNVISVSAEDATILWVTSLA